MNVNKLSNGIYFVELSNDRYKIRKKLIVNR
ncbi:T9SS type A sorting domain-containing protein [Epilithonimonas mollis]